MNSFTSGAREDRNVFIINITSIPKLIYKNCELDCYALISVNWGRPLNRLDIISIVPRLFLPIGAYFLLALIDYVSAKISPSIPEFGPK